jgi:deoxyribodipyrimidine photolyase
MPTLLWFRRDLRLSDHPALTAAAEKFDPSGDYIRRWVPELRSVDDAHLSKGERPNSYPAPIVDHGAERRSAAPLSKHLSKRPVRHRSSVKV